MPLKQWFSTIAIILTIIVIVLFYSVNFSIQAILFIGICIITNGLLFLLLKKNTYLIHSKKLSTNNIKILLVDDSKANRRIALEILAPFEFNILEAESGQKAMELYQKNIFTLILMDIEMEEVNGFDVVKKIRSLENEGKRIPIIAISAHNSREKKLETLITGFDEYLTKPLDGERLISALERWLEKPVKKNTVDKKSIEVVNSPSECHIETMTEPRKTSLSNNAALEFIKEKSTDDSGTIKIRICYLYLLHFYRKKEQIWKTYLRKRNG